MMLTQSQKPYSHWQYSQPDTGDWIRIVPNRGGLITEWFCNGRDMLYFDEESFANPLKSIRGGIPILFPICGNLPEDILPLFNNRYPIKQHGFARNLPWKMEQLDDETGVILSLNDSKETNAYFPFSFLIEMAVRLSPNTLDINVTIYNKDETPMPYSFGLHPYFRVLKLDNLSFEGLPKYCINHLGMLKTKTINLISKLSEGVDFLVDPEGNNIVLCEKEIGTRLKLCLDSPMDLAVVWTDPPRQMICLEPWTAPRNALISGDRKLVIQPGSSHKLACRYISE